MEYVRRGGGGGTNFYGLRMTPVLNKHNTTGKVSKMLPFVREGAEKPLSGSTHGQLSGRLAFCL